MWDTLSFFKIGDLKVSYLKFSEWQVSGEKSSRFQLPWDNQISTIVKLSVYTHVVLLINFPEQFELYFYFKYSKSYKVL